MKVKMNVQANIIIQCIWNEDFTRKHLKNVELL